MVLEKVDPYICLEVGGLALVGAVGTQKLMKDKTPNERVITVSLMVIAVGVMAGYMRLFRSLR